MPDNFFDKKERVSLRNITIEELDETLEDINSVLCSDIAQCDPEKSAACMNKLQGFFHKIGGTASLVGMTKIGEVGRKGEHLASDLIDDHASACKLLRDMAVEIQNLLAEEKSSD